MSKRPFYTVSNEELADYSVKKMAKNTDNRIKSVKKLFVDFLAFKHLAELPNDKNTLDNLLLEFWPSLRKNNANEFMASSLLTMRQNLRNALLHDVSLDNKY